MKIDSLSDLLHLDVSARVETRGDSLHLALDAAAAPQRLYFGLSYFTAPRPLLVAGLMTEKNTLLRAPLLFTWIEDNYIHEPRAEVFGRTTDGEQPIMFLRDFDLDRPRELWLRTGEPLRWHRVTTITLDGRELRDDAGALDAIAATTPDAQPFVAALRSDIAAGRTLKAALRARRKSIDAALMARADAWRIAMTATDYHLKS